MGIILYNWRFSGWDSNVFSPYSRGRWHFIFAQNGEMKAFEQFYDNLNDISLKSD